MRGLDREAVCELRRVAKPSAPVFVSVMGYYAGLRTVLARDPAGLVRPEQEDPARTHDHVHHEGGFRDCHFFLPEELRALAEEAGLETIELRACEGLSSNLWEATNGLREHRDGRWERWLEILDVTQQAPAVVATSEHLLYIGRRPARDE